MFKKLVAIEPVGFNKETEKLINKYAEEVILYKDRPKDNNEIIERIGNADGVLVSYTSNIDREVIEECNSIKYIGMCCSLYAPENANVDIFAAKEKGIVVTGIRDYGDEGVVEYVISELVRLLHGFGENQWKSYPTELTGVKVGIIGLGTTGVMVGNTLKYFGSEVYYYSRSRKLDAEEQGFKYRELKELLEEVEIVVTCLNKNVILLHEEEFKAFGNGKVLVNTSISPSYDIEALKSWLSCSDNYYLCDSIFALGGEESGLMELSNVCCPNKVSGSSIQATGRLCKKVIDNIESFLKENK